MISAKNLIFLFLLSIATLTAPGAPAESAANDLWAKFRAVQQGPRALHQEFEVTKHVSVAYGGDRVARFQLILDLSQGKWRADPVGGAREQIRVFDGDDLFVFESEGKEYARVKRGFDKEKPLPEPYDTKLDWNKAKELESLPCGFSGKDHGCVIFEVPIKPWIRPDTPGSVINMTGGTIRIMADTETGIWLRVHISADVERGNAGGSRYELNYTVKQMSYGAAPDMTLFKIPDGLHEVEKLTPWNEARIKKELAGKPAPNMQVKDLHGSPLSLAELKGSTVLLDFWTTWCPPCQADASSLEKLHRKYGGTNLRIIGISVDEDRDTVEKYLNKHPHGYPVVLSSENQLPRAYQVDALPTYLIIDPDGVLVTAEEGDQGFTRLRKDLEKAGLKAE